LGYAQTNNGTEWRSHVNGTLAKHEERLEKNDRGEPCLERFRQAAAHREKNELWLRALEERMQKAEIAQARIAVIVSAVIVISNAIAVAVLIEIIKRAMH